MKSTIQKMGAKLLRMKHLAIVLAAAGVMAAFTMSAHALGPFTPKKVFLYNNNDEAISTTTTTVATLVVKVGSGEEEEGGAHHRLVVDFSSACAIQPTNANPLNKALMFIGCFVDGNPCVGSQANPPEHNDGNPVPSGYINVLSCDFTNPATCAQWDNSCNHVWYTNELSKGTHTVVIKAAVGNPLVPPQMPPTFFDTRNGPGTLFDEARNLVVTVLDTGSED